jgi:hypothetical protein
MLRIVCPNVYSFDLAVLILLIAGPSSLRGAPSIAAVVASVDSDFVQFPASMRLQNFSEEKQAQEVCFYTFAETVAYTMNR